VAVIAAAWALPVMKLRSGLKDVRRPAALMYGYIVLSLLARVAPRRPGHWAGITSTWTAIRKPGLPCRLMWPCGDRCGCTAIKPGPAITEGADGWIEKAGIVI
jgi:hypothetical protein